MRLNQGEERDMPVWLKLWPVIGSTIAIVSAGSAAAQTPPTREEVLRAPEVAPATAPELSVESDDGIERAACPLAAPEFADIRFTLRQLVFDNIGTLDPALLAPSWQPQAGNELPLSAICEMRDRAATILRREGYLAAVRVPEQRITDGVVHLDILAARLVGIQVRGDAGPSERQLERYLANLQDRPLFNAREAERYLLLANDIPGLDTRLVLRPTGAQGEVVGEVQVTRTPIAFDLNVQNFGSRAVGRYGGIARMRLNGLTGMGDETTFGFYATSDFDEQLVAIAGHHFRIGDEGLAIGSDVTYARTRPSLPGNLAVESRTLVWSSAARYPLRLSQSHSAWANAGFDWIDQDVELAATTLTRDHLRILWAGIDAAWSDPESLNGRGGFTPAEPAWSLGLSMEARHGINGLGASAGCRTNPALCTAPGAIPVSRNEGDPSALVLRASGEFTVRPHPKIALTTLPRVQYARRPLLAYEEMSAGNFTIGRGYDPGSQIGDSGIAYASEVRFGTAVPRSARDMAVQPFVFMDLAWIWNRDTSFAGLNPQRLASVGGGIRFNLGEIARLEVMVAEPLRDVGLVPTRPPTRFLFSLTTQLGLRR